MKVEGLIVAIGLAITLGACSAQRREILEHKFDINRQMDAQMRMVDQRTSELKEAIERDRAQSEEALDIEKKQLDIQRSAIENEKKDLQEHTSFLKANLDKQAAACREQVQRNADNAKDKIVEYYQKK